MDTALLAGEEVANVSKKPCIVEDGIKKRAPRHTKDNEYCGPGTRLQIHMAYIPRFS